MSLNRFVYYNAVIAGWAALLAWLVCEVTFLNRRTLGALAETVLAGVLLALAVGTALNLVSGRSSGRWRPRFSRKLLLGALAAASGGLLGAILYSDLVGLPRFVGWAVMGLGIGAAEGVCEQSATRVRNGLIGGGIGGLVGGLLFDPIATSGSDASSRATAFVILGVSIGGLIGLAHVVLKEAWLTVVDGFQPGRQMILGHTVTVLGRGDHLPLPFLGYAGRDLDSEHLKIIRQPDGQYRVEDNGSRIGTVVNGRPIQGPVLLGDGDLIKLGTNIVRFNQRQVARPAVETFERGPTAGQLGKIAAPPPPPESPEPPTFPTTSGPQPEEASSPGPPAVPGEERGRGDLAPRIPPPPPPPD